MSDELTPAQRADAESAAAGLPPVPCAAPAGLIVMRGAERLFLCGAHRHRYTGRGRVAAYEGRADYAPEMRGAPGGPMLGPVRTCGEVA